MIYLDASALLKLIIAEKESDALGRWLSSRPDTTKLSSELVSIEVLRACRRVDPETVAGGRRLLAGLDFIPATADIREHAATLGEPVVRSLDAVHLASAVSLGAELSAFVAYDQRLLVAARGEGLPVLVPG